MRTGKFSELTGLSKDTIYYYIDRGLIYPDRVNNRYSFNKKNLENVEIIKLYQDMDFSIDEIISIISLWNWSNNTEENIKNEHLNRLLKKEREIENDISKLVRKKELLIDEINRIDCKNEENFNNTEIGFPVKNIAVLSCPRCNNQFSINNASMNSKYIFNADLECPCGHKLKIKNGIVVTGNKYKSFYDKPDINRDLYLDMPSIYYKSLNIIGNEISKYLNSLELENKIIMETNINGFSFLYNNLKYFKNNFTIILIDKYEEVLLNYKNQLSKVLENPNIVFIADDSLEYPIKKEVVDVVISLFSGNEHQLYKKDNYFENIYKYIKNNGSIVGAYQSYESNSKSIKNLKIKYPESSEILYLKNIFLDNLNKFFKQTKSVDLEKVNAYSNKHSFECHEKGDLMTHTIFKGIK